MIAQVLWNSTRALPIAAAAALAVIAALAWLYRAQVKDLRGGWRWGLPALRGLAVLALAASLLKPSVLRPKTADERPAVVVIVDRSRSMSVADNARTPAQLVALADGLGRLPPSARSESAAGLAAEIAGADALADAAARARGDWEYARVSGRAVEAARRRAEESATRAAAAARGVAARSVEFNDKPLRDALRAVNDATSAAADEAGPIVAPLRARLSDALAAALHAQAAVDEQLFESNESVRGVCDALSKLSRLQLVAQALARPRTGLLSTIGGRASVVGFGVADRLDPVALSPGGTSQEPPWTRADGHASHVAGAVREALDRVGGREVAAVVLFSDGRQVGGEGSVTAGLSATGVPVFTVAAAAAGATRDVSFARVSLPSSAFIGEAVTVRAELKPLGFSASTIDVTATLDGGGTPTTRPAAAGDARAPAAEFQLRLSRPGAQRITLRANPVSGEATTENNSVTRWVKVLSQRVKVAAVGTAGWDFQYLRNALQRTTWAQLQSAVLRPGERARLPLTPGQILDQDVLILSDVPAAALEDGQWEAVYRLVAERGGSVILLAGESHLPAEYSKRLVTANLLPYPPDIEPSWRLWPGEQALFRLAPDATASQPFLRLGDDATAGADGRRSPDRWQALPGLYRFLPIGPLKTTAKPLLIEVASGSPVLTEMRVGAGRSFLLGTNETWRWRLKAGEGDQERFWLGLVRYAAGEPYAVQSARASLDLDRVAVEAGESARARVRTPVFGAASAGAGGQRFHLEVFRDGHFVRRIALAAVDARDPSRLEATVSGLPEGDYEVRLAEGGVSGSPPTQPTTAPATSPQAPFLPLHVVRSYEAELADLSGDESILRRMAEASGGESFTLDQVDRLGERLRLVAERRPRYVEQRLWDSPLLFVFVVGCLAAEWAARKRVGLA